MKHTIKTPSGTITIQPAGKPGTEFVLVSLHKPPFPQFDIQLTAEHAGLLSQAFDLAAEEIAMFERTESQIAAFPKFAA